MTMTVDEGLRSISIEGSKLMHRTRAHLSWVRGPVPGGPLLPLCSDLMRCRCMVMLGK